MSATATERAVGKGRAERCARTRTGQVGRAGNPKAPWQMTRDEFVAHDPRGLRGYFGAGVDETAAMVRAHDHQVHVKRALAAGKPVPERVLADYPDLREGNPGAITRFLGGVTRRAELVLPFDEFVDKVRGEMVRKGLHQAGVPLESPIVEELRDLHTAAAGAYRAGGPEEVDRLLAGGKRNPLDLPDWIKTGTAAMLGTAYTTRPFPTAAALRKAVAPYRYMGQWKVFRESRWSDKAGKDLPGYTGVIYKGDAADKTLYDSRLRPEHVMGKTGNPLDLATVIGAGLVAGVASGVVQPYATKHVYEEGALGAGAGTASNPRQFQGHKPYPVLIQVFGKGYVAGSEMTPDGIKDRYTDDPAEAHRFSLLEAEDFQRRHPGAFAAMGVREAFEVWRKYGRKGNPAGRFYAAPDDWPIGPQGKWWSVYDTVTREKMHRPEGGAAPWRYGSERLAQRAADKLNRDWAAGRIRVIPDADGERGAA